MAGQVFAPGKVISKPAIFRPTQAIGVDLDNDGLKDVIVSGDLNELLVWFKNLGDGSFGDKQIVLIDSSYNNLVKSVINKDMDNDGDQDLVACSYIVEINALGGISPNNQELFWVENNGFGLFGPKQIIDTSEFNDYSNITSFEEFELFIDDLNSDGLDDFFFSSLSSWYKNAGNNNWTSIQTIQYNQVQFNSYTIVDINNDGTKEIIASIPSPFNSLNHQLFLLETDGLGNIINGHIIDSSYTIYDRFRLADMNNDALPDIVYSKKDTLGWYRNLGNSQFSDKVLINTNSGELGRSDFICTDFDSDGKLDILFTFIGEFDPYNQPQNNYNTIFKNFDSGIFQNVGAIEMEFLNKLEKISSIDVNNDGKEDILSLTDERVFWIENLGNFLFSNENIIAGDFNLELLKLLDFDLDLDLDVMAQSGWYENLGSGVFSNFKSYFSNYNYVPYRIFEIADVNADTYPDLIIKSQEVLFNPLQTTYDSLKAFLNNGQNIFNDLYSFDFTLKMNIRGSLIFDADNNGTEDLMIFGNSINNVDYDTSFVIFLKDQNGAFIGRNYGILTDSLCLQAIAGSYINQVVDLDNDGFLDIVGTSTDPNSQYNKLFFYRNNGLGGFFPAFIINNIPDMQTAVFKDIDYDGDSDIIFIKVLPPSDIENVYLVYNLNNLNFTEPELLNPDINIYHFGKLRLTNELCTDFNLDGYIDIIAPKSNGILFPLSYDNLNNFSLFINQEGDFQYAEFISNYYTFGKGYLVGDVDGDGDLDLFSDDYIFGNGNDNFFSGFADCFTCYDYTVTMYENLASKVVSESQNNYINLNYSIYPNPAVTVLNIKLYKKTYKFIVSITTITGIVVYKSEFSNLELLQIPLNLPSGLYTINISNRDFVENKKFIILN